MSYIGRKPTVGNFQICDAISVVNGQAAYTMQVGSVNVIPQSANHMIVSLNGTIQKPNSSFTVSGAVITFSSNLVTNDVIDFIQILGDVLDLGTPSDATVTTAKLASTSVTAAKLNNDIISGTTALTSEPADTDEFLVSDAGVLKRIDYSLIKGGGITMADQWRLSADFDPSGSSADITANLERNDSGSFNYLGSGMSQSSGIFTFPSTGFYLVSYQLSAKITSGTDAYLQGDIRVTADNSSYVTFSRARLGLDVDGVVSNSGFTNTIVDVTNTSNVKVKFDVSSVAAASVIMGESTRTETGFTFIRLGDT